MRPGAGLALALPLLCCAMAFPPQPPGAEDRSEDRPAKRGADGPQGKFPGPQDGFMLRLQSLCSGGLYQGRIEGGAAGPADEPLTLGPAKCRLEGGVLKEIALPVAGGGAALQGWAIVQENGEIRLRPLRDGAAASLPAEGEGTFTRQRFPAASVEIVPGDRLTVRAAGGPDAAFDLTRRISDRGLGAF